MKRIIFVLAMLMVIAACTTQELPKEDNKDVKVISNINTGGQKIEMDNTPGYNPTINPSEFSYKVNNKYFDLSPGTKRVYEAETDEGTERIEVYVTRTTKVVMGIKTTVVWDRVWLNDEIIEDTYDWYAQDKEGNVWYFGEDSKEMLNGKITSTKGSWEYGKDNALPGIIMKANPKVGETYQQEYYKGEAEDKADVLELDSSADVTFGKFTGCLKTLDYSPLEPNAKENKYYCQEAGGVVLEVDLESGDRVELISIEYDAEPSPSMIENGSEPERLVTKISEDEAMNIAIREVPGEVTDIAIERKYGKEVYVVEVDADNGPETDVIIDIDTGDVLGIET